MQEYTVYDASSLLERMQNRITGGKDMHGKPRHVFTVRLHRIPGRTVVAFFPFPVEMRKFGFGTRLPGKSKFCDVSCVLATILNCNFAPIPPLPRLFREVEGRHSAAHADKAVVRFCLEGIRLHLTHYRTNSCLYDHMELLSVGGPHKCEHRCPQMLKRRVPATRV